MDQSPAIFAVHTLYVIVFYMFFFGYSYTPVVRKYKGKQKLYFISKLNSVLDLRIVAQILSGC